MLSNKILGKKSSAITKKKCRERMQQVLLLKTYIEENLFDMDNGNGEYLHSPHIKRAINDFDAAESLDFSAVIENWDEKILFELADPILFGTNDYLDKDFLYCLIYSKVTEKENADYLMQNLTPCLLGLNADDCSITFLKALKEKVLKDSKIYPPADGIAINTLDEKIAQKK